MAVHDCAPLRTVRRLFADRGFPYWIAGGWAIDLFAGRSDREHSDVDVLVRLRDLECFIEAFNEVEFQVKDHSSGDVRAWKPGAQALVAGRHSLLFPPGATDSHGVEVVFGLADGDDWVFHRGRGRTRRPLPELTRRASNGLPYVSAEVALLFKARNLRPKDHADFAAVAHLLDAGQCAWLAPRLQPPGAAGDHPWLAALTAPK